MSPPLTVCALPGCPTLTTGNYCVRHANMTEAQEHAEITAVQERRARHHDLMARLDREDDQ